MIINSSSILLILIVINLIITIFALLKIKINSSTSSDITRSLLEQRDQISAQQLQTLKTIMEGMQSGMNDIRMQISLTLNNHTQNLTERVEKLTQTTDLRLKEISGQVDKRLAEGFEKTTETFTDVIKRLALIDEAQKKITDLSANVISLQEILNDKRSRGAFGEIQLSALVHNVLPPDHFSLQHTLSNGKRVDCILFLPEPSGNIVIDAKFPLESYQQLTDTSLSKETRRHSNSALIFASTFKTLLKNISSQMKLLTVP